MIGEGAVHFDFTGTSAQAKGPMNCVPSGSAAAAYYAVRAVTEKRKKKTKRILVPVLSERKLP